MDKYILAIDQGTTGTTVALIDKKTSIVSKTTVDVPRLFPKPGFVEHNPEDIWSSIVLATRKCLKLSKIHPGAISSIGITNQRETVVLWDKKTGSPLHNAIVWQCRRTADLCASLKERGLEEEFHKKTGLYLDPYFSGTKIKWLLNNTSKINYSNLCCGTVDSYLDYRLTGGKSFFTEPSNASRTLLFNIFEMRWDESLANYLDIPIEILPVVKESSSDFGYTENLDFLPDGIPINGILGDQQAALFGQLCFNKGDCKCTYGTGAFLLLNCGKDPVFSKNNLLTTVAWKHEGRTCYALEGSVFIAGAAVQWLRDGLKVIKSAGDIEKLAAQVSSSGGVYFVPALSGLGAPHWDPHARGLITGITGGTTVNHIARATLEGIAFQVYDLIQAMEKDISHSIKELRVDGGASKNGILMQFQSDLLNSKIIRPEFIETTAMGAAFIAGLKAKFWDSKSEITGQVCENQEYLPDKERAHMDTHVSGWKEAFKKCLTSV